MNLLKRPSLLTFLFAIVVGVLAIISHLGLAVPTISSYSFWVMTAAYIMLVMGCLFRGM
ncbi:MAG: hypothetical protein CMB79_01270 [Filomicrobium sp.]|nr:hypothetical protein [Filomicrobium sp.]